MRFYYSKFRGIRARRSSVCILQQRFPESDLRFCFVVCNTFKMCLVLNLCLVLRSASFEFEIPLIANKEYHIIAYYVLNINVKATALSARNSKLSSFNYQLNLLNKLS